MKADYMKHLDRGVEDAARQERNARRLMLFANSTAALLTLAGALVALFASLVPPVQHHPWWETVNWKQVALFVGGGVVAVLSFLKLLFEVIKSALDVRDRWRS